MPGKIILNVTGGELAGTRYRFDTRMLCLVGRAENCTIQLAGTAGEGVSRQHCLLDIRPPKIYVKDLGSRNGTFLNDIDIGTGGLKEPSFHEMSNGDSLRIAGNVFRACISAPTRCYVCHKELPEGWNDTENAAPDSLVCPECRAAGLREPVLPASKTLPVRTCMVCGISVTFAPGNDVPSPSEFVCQDCRMRQTDPHSTFKMPDRRELPSNLFTLSGYRVLRHIGRGGMGEVYLAQSTETLEKAAVKVLRPDIASFDTCRADFLREANNLKNLRHPNIVELKECREEGNAVFLVLEYCAEGTLRAWMKKRARPLELRTALDLTYQILDALDYAHHVRLKQVSPLDDCEHIVTGIVHRDIKPENIFISEIDGIPNAKISDFGLAKAFEMAGISGCTRTGDFSGTLGFIPKQQFLNYKYVRPEVDVWAAAATLFYMLTGASPRDAAHTSSEHVFDRKPYPILALNREITPALAHVLDDALDDSERLRYTTAGALKMALLDSESK